MLLAQLLTEEIQFGNKSAELSRYIGTLPAEYKNPSLEKILRYWFLNDDHFKAKDLYQDKLSNVLNSRVPADIQDILRSAMIWYIHKGRNDVVDYLKKIVKHQKREPERRLKNVDPIGASYSSAIKKFDAASKYELEEMDNEELSRYESDLEKYRRWYSERNQVLKRERVMRAGQVDYDEYTVPSDPPEYNKIKRDIHNERLRRKNLPTREKKKYFGDLYEAEIVSVNMPYLLCYTKLGETEYYMLTDTNVTLREERYDDEDDDDYNDQDEHQDDYDYDQDDRFLAGLEPGNKVELKKQDILAYASIGPSGKQIKVFRNVSYYLVALGQFIQQGHIPGFRLAMRNGKKVIVK